MVKLTAKQEHFAQLLLDPEHSQSSAYREAYNVSPDTADESVWTVASRIAGSVKVRSRVRELKEAIHQSDVFTVDKLRTKLEVRSDDAADAGQFGPSVRALEMIGKLDGLIVDKKDVNVAITGTISHEIGTDELRQLMLDGQAIAARLNPGGESKVIEHKPGTS